MVKFIRNSSERSGCTTTGIRTDAAPTISRATQYAGYSRAIRERKKSPRVLPQLLMQITKPLMTKKNCTPRQP